jgi:hypothetical protein
MPTKTAEQWQAEFDVPAEYDGWYHFTKSLLDDYTRLEASHRHLMAIVLRLAERCAAGAPMPPELEAVVDMAIRVLEVTRQQQAPAATAE